MWHLRLTMWHTKQHRNTTETAGARAERNAGGEGGGSPPKGAAPATSAAAAGGQRAGDGQRNGREGEKPP